MTSELPDYQKKQDIVYRDRASAEELIGYGDRCREAGRIFDALEFYQKAQHGPGLEEIRSTALSTGDAMLFELACKALHQNAVQEEWNRLGRQALALKKHAFARYAFEKGGDTAMVDEIGRISGKEIEEANGDKT